MVIQGAILAAGRGERLRAASGGIPKPLVEVGGVPMLVRQCNAMLAAGAASVVAIVNSETAALAQRVNLAMPANSRLIARDTASSMETMLALGEYLEPGWFLGATVDAIAPADAIAEFVRQAILMTEAENSLAGVLAVTKWRGDTNALFVELTSAGLISQLGGGQSNHVTAGFYFLSTRIFQLASRARARGLDALRKFLAMAIESGMSFGAVEISGVIDVDEGADLRAARESMKERG